MTRVTRLIHNAGKYLLISIYPLPTHPTHNFTHKHGGNLDTLPGWPKKLDHNRPARCAGQQYNTVCVSNITNSRVIIDFVVWFCWWPQRSRVHPWTGTFKSAWLEPVQCQDVGLMSRDYINIQLHISMAIKTYAPGSSSPDLCGGLVLVNIIPILQDYFTDTGAIWSLVMCQGGGPKHVKWTEIDIIAARQSTRNLCAYFMGPTVQSLI